MSLTGGKSRLGDTSPSSLYTVLTGQVIQKEASHSALYDAQVLCELFFKFTKGDFYPGSFANFRRDNVVNVNYTTIKDQVMAQRSNRKANRWMLYYVPGFQ